MGVKTTADMTCDKCEKKIKTHETQGNYHQFIKQQNLSGELDGKTIKAAIRYEVDSEARPEILFCGKCFDDIFFKNK